MRLFTLSLTAEKTTVCAALSEDSLLNLELADRLAGGDGAQFATMLDLIDSGESGLTRARSLISAPSAESVILLRDARLLAPIPVPRRLRDAGMFIEHLEVALAAAARMLTRGAADPEAAAAALLQSEQFQLPEVATRRCCYYNGNHLAVIGPDAPLHWPNDCQTLDYELEVAVVVGSAGSCITPEQAPDHIFGYTLMNDWSNRDVQVDVFKSGAGPCMGKDHATSLGPCIVTPDEIGDPHDLAISAWIDGECWSSGSTRNMHHSFFAALSEFSRISPLVPGEVIGTGTCAHGSAFEQGRRLVPGQTVELRADAIGSLRNLIVA
jgi:2-keto-4-pentenoate hydratase/2-oxohepta-3-ene-1,7-dioic acid hydratase in catechol pathway